MATLRAIDGVTRVHRLDDDRLEATVDDAGRMVPELIEALRAADVDVDEVEAQHATFDDVFVRLMENDDARVASRLPLGPAG